MRTELRPGSLGVIAVSVVIPMTIPANVPPGSFHPWPSGQVLLPMGALSSTTSTGAAWN
jgi:hypothetical protein